MVAQFSRFGYMPNSDHIVEQQIMDNTMDNRFMSRIVKKRMSPNIQRLILGYNGDVKMIMPMKNEIIECVYK